MWELQRPALDPLPTVDHLTSPDKKRNFQIDQLSLAKHPQLTAWLQQKDALLIDQLYSEVLECLKNSNGDVVEFSPAMSLLTGSHHHTSFIGSAEQGKSAMFYISGYFGKNKLHKEQCLQLLWSVLAHIKKYPSSTPETAEDPSGSHVQTAQHALNRILNRLYLMMEISDNQAAAVLIDLPTEISSEKFEFMKPYDHIAFAMYDKNKKAYDAAEDKILEDFNNRQDELAKQQQKEVCIEDNSMLEEDDMSSFIVDDDDDQWYEEF